MLETQTIIAVAVIGAIAALLTGLFKQLFSRNQNKKDEQDFILQLLSGSNETNKLLQQISFKLGENGSELKSINDKMEGLTKRVDRLEEEVFDNEKKRIG